MKNIRNAYDRIYNNYGNSDEQLSPFQYSRVEQMDDSQTSVFGHHSSSNEERKDEGKPSGMPIFSFNKPDDEQVGSVPLILPPPKVEATQITESSQLKVFKKDPTANKLKQKKDRASHMLTPFSPMLEWSPSLPSHFFTDKTHVFPIKNQALFTQEEINALNAESSSEEQDDFKSDESSSAENQYLIEESSSAEVDFASLADEFLSMLNDDFIDEKDEESPAIHDELSAFQDEVFSLIAESSPEMDETTFKELSPDLEYLEEYDESSEEIAGSHDEWDDILENKISSLLNSFTAILKNSSANLNDDALAIDESSSINGSLSLNTEESSSIQEISIESSSNEECPLLEESSLINEEFEKEYFHAEECEDESYQPCQEHQSSPKKHLPIVKLPVLVSNLDLELNIFDSYPLTLPIGSLTKLEWSNQSLISKVVLPSATVFFKGVLIADIEYVKNGAEQTVHTVKIPVPWEKTASLNWLYPPVMPESNSQKEFLFSADDGHGLSSHYEYDQKFSEPIECQLKGINFVWHEELNQETKPNIEIQGRAVLSIDLLQQQYLHLNQ